MHRLRPAYSLIAIVVLNTLALFVIANAAAALWLRFQRDEPKAYERAWLIEGYGLDTLARNYPHLSRDDLTAFLFEASNWVQEYEPFTGFRPVPRRDRFISISRDGFRPVPNQAPWPPPADKRAVFLFGGSTMMGAGLPDDSTIAAHLQRALTPCAVAIYNFGRGFYFSTQERILFEQLLLAGHRPALAIFFDGLNDFYFAEGVPQFTAEMTAAMTRSAGLPADPGLMASLAAVARQLPIVRAAARYGLVSSPSPVPFGQGPPQSARPESERIEAVLSRWERNRTLIRASASAYDVRAAFVWQPVPTYGYDLTKLTVYREGMDLGAHNLSGRGYPLAAKRYGNWNLGRDVLWLGDIQRNRAENLYVDAVHYTNRFSSDIAERINRFLMEERLLPCEPGNNGE